VAGHLYTLIKNKNIIEKMEDKFGTIGISNISIREKNVNDEDEIEKKYRFNEYLKMNDKKRRGFLSKLSIE
jgi:hypothetical protein